MPGPATGSAYPGALDALPEILANDREDALGLEHDVVHTLANAAINALQAEIGTTDDEAGTVRGRVAGLEAREHGDLDGLGDDDHPHYLTNARGDARYDALGGVRGALVKQADSVPTAALGVTVATLVGGLVPSAQLPGFVDDVLEYADLAAFPVTGSTGVIYLALDTNKQYRWSGTVYVELVSSPGTTDDVPEGSTNLYHTAARVLGTVLTGLSLATNAVRSRRLAQPTPVCR